MFLNNLLQTSVLRSPGLVLSAAAAAATAFATTWTLDEAVADSSFSPTTIAHTKGPAGSRDTAVLPSAAPALPASASGIRPGNAPLGTSRPCLAASTTPAATAAPSHGEISNPAAAGASPLPTDKLSCKLRALPPRTPVVLVSCGSFNPPTVMHMRMVDIAAAELAQRGYDVWGAYLSPVADSYGKKDLAPAADRVAMCHLAANATAEPAAGTAASSPVLLPVSATAPAASSVTSPAPPPRLPRPVPDPDLVMVYDWEARQPGYTRTLAVLQRVESELRSWLRDAGSGVEAAQLAGAEANPRLGTSPGPGPVRRPEGLGTEAQAQSHNPPQAEHVTRVRQLASEEGEPGTGASRRGKALRSGDAGDPRVSYPRTPVRAMLLCGGDVLASMTVPGVWRDPDLILRDHGVVCVAREGTDLERFAAQPGSVLYDYRDRIVVVYDRVGNSISSSKVRQELAAGRPVRYLVPPSVLSYIYANGLYGTGDSTGPTND